MTAPFTGAQNATMAPVNGSICTKPRHISTASATHELVYHPTFFLLTNSNPILVSNHIKGILILVLYPPSRELPAQHRRHNPAHSSTSPTNPQLIPSLIRRPTMKHPLLQNSCVSPLILKTALIFLIMRRPNPATTCHTYPHVFSVHYMPALNLQCLLFLSLHNILA